MSDFTHLDENQQPQMVDVAEKPVTRRTARAKATVNLTPEVMKRFERGDIQSKKGPVFHTAIIAGIQAAKKTSDLIPLCHPLPIAKCSVTVEPIDDSRVIVRTEVVTDAKTGVEMEALSAASVAALTLYDMCKAITKGIVIENIRLVEKTGGKSDFQTNTV
jgi:cyclic pyranopterin phosphate synthase